MVVSEQLAQAVLVTIGRDLKHRDAVGEGAPQSALAAAQAPPGLIDIDVRRSAHPPEQLLMRLGQCVAGASEDVIDRAAADPRAEQLLAQLHGVAARDPVAHRQRRDRCLQARPERARGDLGG